MTCSFLVQSASNLSDATLFGETSCMCDLHGFGPMRKSLSQALDLQLNSVMYQLFQSPSAYVLKHHCVLLHWLRTISIISIFCNPTGIGVAPPPNRTIRDPSTYLCCCVNRWTFNSLLFHVSPSILKSCCWLNQSNVTATFLIPSKSQESLDFDYIFS